MIELTAAEKRHQAVLQRHAALWTPDQMPEEVCITYRPLWNQAEGLPADTPYTTTNPHATMLFHIGVFEAEHGRPMLTSLVVNSHTNWPGSGFIHRLAAKIGHPDIPNEDDEAGMRAFWAARLRETVEYWSAPAAVVAIAAIDAAEMRLRTELKTLGERIRRG